MAEITIIIPHRHGERCDETLISLSRQTFTDFITFTIEDYEGLGAPYARNRGFAIAPKSKYVLFSDNDLIWYPRSLEKLYGILERTPAASYSYGSYLIYKRETEQTFLIKSQCFSGPELKKNNFISTSSLIRWDDFPDCGYDEKLMRFQDWDLWLTMLNKGKQGIFCGESIFATILKPGISTTPPEVMQEAIKYIKRKHGI